MHLISYQMEALKHTGLNRPKHSAPLSDLIIIINFSLRAGHVLYTSHIRIWDRDVSPVTPSSECFLLRSVTETWRLSTATAWMWFWSRWTKSSWRSSSNCRTCVAHRFAYWLLLVCGGEFKVVSPVVMLLIPVCLCLCVAGVVGQRAGEERGHRSRRSPHDPHEADRWYVTPVLHSRLHRLPQTSTQSH